MLTKVSGRDFFMDAGGEKQSAVKWLLDVVAGGNADEHEIVPIQNPKLLALLEFTDDARVRRWFRTIEKDAKPREAADPPRFALAEIRPKFELIDSETKRIQRDVEFDDYNDFHHAVVDLRGQLQAFNLVSSLHRFPDLTDIETFRGVFQRLNEIDRFAMFQMVPAREANGQWQTALRAAVMLRASEVLEKEPNPAALALKAIFAAYREKEADDFNARLSEYRKWANTNAVFRSPFSFTVPKTWRETGVRVAKGDQMFGSAIANGDTIAEFDIGEGEQPIKAFVRHFTGKTMPDTQIHNDWRIASG